MDVHHYNSRLFARKCSVLVHVALPSTLLETAGVVIGNAQEEDWRVSVRTERMTGERTRIFHPTCKISTEPSFTKQEASYVLITSLPLLFLKESLYNGLDVVHLRVVYGKEMHSVQIRFFYLTLINGFLRNCDSSVMQSASPDLAVTPDAFDLLLRDVAEKKNDPCVESTKTDPTICALADMLNRFTAAGSDADPQTRHHPALEDPGRIRSSLNSISKNAAPLLTLRRPKIRIDATQWVPRTVARAISLLYGESFWIFLYPGCRWSPTFTNWYHTLPVSTLESLKPLAWFEARGQFILRKQVEFIGSLLMTVGNMGDIVNQALPFCLVGDYQALSSVVMVACQALLLQETENQAWIRAGLSLRNKKPGLWCEVNDLVPGMHLKCGRDLLFIKRGEFAETSESNLDWSCVLQHPEIQRALGVQDLFCVVVDEVTLAAALILPGGFLIKGHYSLSEEDRLFLRRNYGFFDRSAIISE